MNKLKKWKIALSSSLSWCHSVAIWGSHKCWLLNLQNSAVGLTSLNSFCRWRIFYILFWNLKSPCRENGLWPSPNAWGYGFKNTCLCITVYFLTRAWTFYSCIWLCVVCSMASSPDPWLPCIRKPSYSGLLAVMEPTLVIHASRAFIFAAPYSWEHAFEN